MTAIRHSASPVPAPSILARLRLPYAFSGRATDVSMLWGGWPQRRTRRSSSGGAAAHRRMTAASPLIGRGPGRCHGGDAPLDEEGVFGQASAARGELSTGCFDCDLRWSAVSEGAEPSPIAHWGAAPCRCHCPQWQDGPRLPALPREPVAIAAGGRRRVCARLTQLLRCPRRCR